MLLVAFTPMRVKNPFLFQPWVSCTAPPHSFWKNVGTQSQAVSILISNLIIWVYKTMPGNLFFWILAATVIATAAHYMQYYEQDAGRCKAWLYRHCPSMGSVLAGFGWVFQHRNGSCFGWSFLAESREEQCRRKQSTCACEPGEGFRWCHILSTVQKQKHLNVP